MEAISQHMANSIFDRQNEKMLLQCQLAQRRAYSKAKYASMIEEILIFVFSIASIVSVTMRIDFMSALSGLFAVLVTLFNKNADGYIRSQKRHAAIMQQYIDVTLFSAAIGGSRSEWGELPSETDLAKAISEFEGADTTEVTNWYSDYSALPVEAQVFYCQRENIRWSYSLHRAYTQFKLVASLIVAAAMVVALVAFDPNFTRMICVVSWLMPIIEYTYSERKVVERSISLLKEIDIFCDQIEKQLSETSHSTVRDELIDLQHRIEESRKDGYLIPDWFYWMHREKRQEREDRISETIARLNCEHGERE